MIIGMAGRISQALHASFPPFIGCFLLVILLAPGWASTVAAQAPPFVADGAGEFKSDGEPPMKMPTDATVDAEGRVFVADGVNRRVVVFSPDGSVVEILTAVGDRALSNPTGLAVDSAGRLFICDTGLRKVLVRSKGGQLVQELIPQARADEHKPDPTDVAVDADGAYAWIADNDNDRMVRVDLSTGTQTIMGRRGESVGELQYPFMVAIGSEGDVFVTDVINSRISVFTKNAAPSQPIGSYGVEPGQLYRPKGVAVDRNQNVWVSDGTLGVVQVFTFDGGFIDVLRDAAGEPFHFESPMGLAFDSQMNLYVVELTRNRVRKLKITAGPRRDSTARKAAAQVTGSEARSCTVCHLEWMPPFSKGEGTLLAAVPSNTPEQPAVSRGEVCLSCHDASVVDSRQRVWQQHGHQTGIAPPPTMKVPPNLPLADGKIACRTCHSAHTGGQFTADFRTAVFLRVANPASELCISCHRDQTRGPQGGTHPIGGMPWPIPKALIDAGAKVGPNPRELTCQVCHTPHGSKEDRLLVMGTSGNQLCLNCHDQMRPGMFREGGPREHPLSPRVNAEQASAIASMGTRLGPDDKLICLSCHKLHHGKDGHFMLAEDLSGGRFCIQCHSEKKPLIGSLHDLRTNHPDEKNRLGMTPESGGPCSACHLFHRYARSPEPSDLDPGGGKCITCHQPGRCAQSKVLGTVNHPGARCVDCHNPHDPTRKNFVRAETKDLCAKCHQDQMQLIDGPHDYRKTGRKWPDDAVAMQDTCFVCHRPHGDESTGLFRVAGAAGGNDAGCRICHSTYLWGANSNLAALHPNEMTPERTHGDLPLVSAKVGEARSMGCKTCHNPHAAVAANPSMLRSGSDQSPLSLCTTCHLEAMALALTSHDATGLTKAGFKGAAMCAPCHVVHGNAKTVDPHRLWPRSLGTAVAEAPSPNAYCTACHREGGAAKRPRIATHPRVSMQIVAAAQPDPMFPLFDEHGNEDRSGQIACGTCHLPHGRPMAKPDTEFVESLSPREQKAARLMLRTFRAPNLCTTCHGGDALRRFLYFHDPDRRSGPLLKDWASRQ